jgi:hypothetical protein
MHDLMMTWNDTEKEAAGKNLILDFSRSLQWGRGIIRPERTQTVIFCLEGLFKTPFFLLGLGAFSYLSPLLLTFKACPSFDSSYDSCISLRAKREEI